MLPPKSVDGDGCALNLDSADPVLLADLHRDIDIKSASNDIDTIGRGKFYFPVNALVKRIF